MNKYIIKSALCYSFMLIALITVMSSCEYDNYDEPNVTLSGVLMNGDKPLDTKRGIAFKLYQYREDGFVDAGTRSLDVYVDQEGQFKALLFPGRYKMVVNENNGGKEDPDISTLYTWSDFPKNESNGNLDTLYFTLDRSKKIDFQVKPYYDFENLEAFYRNDSIVVRFSVSKNIESDDTQLSLRKINLFVGPTVHINRETALYASLPTSMLKPGVPIEFKYSLEHYYKSTGSYVNNFRTYAYIRLGLALRLDPTVYSYSKVIKVEGIPTETINKFK